MRQNATLSELWMFFLWIFMIVWQRCTGNRTLGIINLKIHYVVCVVLSTAYCTLLLWTMCGGANDARFLIRLDAWCWIAVVGLIASLCILCALLVLQRIIWTKSDTIGEPKKRRLHLTCLAAALLSFTNHTGNMQLCWSSTNADLRVTLSPSEFWWMSDLSWTSNTCRSHFHKALIECWVNLFNLVLASVGLLSYVGLTTVSGWRSLQCFDHHIFVLTSR